MIPVGLYWLHFGALAIQKEPELLQVAQLYQIRVQRHALGNPELVGKQNHLCDAWTLVLALLRCQALLAAPARYRCVAIRLEDLRLYLDILR
jgi:hypothetical protein